MWVTPARHLRNSHRNSDRCIVAEENRKEEKRKRAHESKNHHGQGVASASCVVIPGKEGRFRTVKTDSDLDNGDSTYFR